MKILIGCEESQTVCKSFRAKGHEAYSCDILECSGGHPEWHFKMDVFKAIKAGLLTLQNGGTINIDNWDIGILFPDCTYLTCSAEWAYKEGPYHQKLKPGTLAGKERVKARADAYEFFMALYNCGISKIAIENPVGIMSRYFRKPDQVIQPYQFGENASKATCLWLKNLSLLKHTTYYEPRTVNNKKYWGNQTDGGQNKLPPSADRAKLRSKTYAGIATAMADQWG